MRSTGNVLQGRSISIRLAVLMLGIVTMLACFEPTSKAGTGVTLPIASFFDIVVDDAHGQLFLSQGFGSSEIVAVDFVGNMVGTIAASEAYELALSDDGTTLYTALAGSDEIASFSTETLLPAGAPVAAGAQLNGQLAIAGGSLWFGFEGGTCPPDGNAYLGSVPIGGGSITTYSGGDFPTSSPQLTTSPAAPNTLVTSNSSCAGNPFAVWDVSTASPVALAGPELLPEFPWSAQEMDSAGTTLFVADGSIVRNYRVSDLTEQPGVYNPWPSGATSLATTSVNGGWLAAADRPNPYPGPAVSLFAPGQGKDPQAQYLSGNVHVCPGGLAFSEDAATLFVIKCKDGSIALARIDRPARFASGLTITAPKVVNPSGPFKVTAHLPSFDTNGAVRISKTPLDKGTKLLIDQAVNGDGDLTTKASIDRKTTFAASYAGDDRYLPGTVKITVTVRTIVKAKMIHGAGRSGRYTTYANDARYAAKVIPDKGGRKLSVLLQGYVGGRWRELARKSFRLRANSTLVLRLVGFPNGAYRLQGEYPGDRYTLRGRSSWDYFKIT
jgi:hypothetical protein